MNSRKRRQGILHALSSLPLVRERPLTGYLVALVLSGVGLLLRWALEPLLPPGYPFVTFFPAVIATAFLSGTRPALLAAVLGAVFSRYFFVLPVHSLDLMGGAGMAMALYAFVVGVDIILVDGMQRAFRQLEQERERTRALADHREVLFRELQHRVGNNLQMVGALLSLQKRNLTDPDARAALNDAAHRLTLIGRIQRELYGGQDDNRGLDGFLREITRDIVSSAGRMDIGLTVEGGDDLWLHPDDAIPVALITAEAVSNALEHGFAAGRGGMIRIAITHNSPMLTIAIENDGRPLPPSFDASASGSLGLRLATNLAVGRKGTFLVTAGGLGTVATVTLPHQVSA